jgi:hypothetical protein
MFAMKMESFTGYLIPFREVFCSDVAINAIGVIFGRGHILVFFQDLYLNILSFWILTKSINYFKLYFSSILLVSAVTTLACTFYN